MFPNTSLLLNIRQESIYVICDEKYQNMQDEAGKGGYDLFHTFAVIFLDILSELRIDKRISELTFIFVKKIFLDSCVNGIKLCCIIRRNILSFKIIYVIHC